MWVPEVDKSIPKLFLQEAYLCLSGVRVFHIITSKHKVGCRDDHRAKNCTYKKALQGRICKDGVAEDCCMRTTIRYLKKA